MFRSARTIINRLLEGLSTERNWLPPSHVDVLIYDARGSVAFEDGIREISMPFSVGNLPSPRSTLNVPVLLASLLRKGNWSDAYSDSYISFVKPRVVVTYIDNSPNFYSISLRNSNVKTLFIQNGFRSYLVDVFEILDKRTSRSELKVDFMATFGNLVGAEYRKYISGLVLPIGSFRNNLVPVRRGKIKGTLGYISQYRNVSGIDMGGGYYSFEEFWAQVDGLIIPFLLKYADNNSLEFRIIPCCGQGNDLILAEKERSYFNRLAKRSCKFSEIIWHGSSYDAIDETEVIVAVDSSMGLEAIARGTKAAIFSIRGILLSLPSPNGFRFGWPGNYPDDGKFWTNRPDISAFNRILEYLFQVSDDDWRGEIKRQGFEDVIQYDPGNSMLRDLIQKELQDY